MLQYNITPKEIEQACQLFTEWELEFEKLYYQWCIDCIHFIHLCVHLTNYLTWEMTHIGAPICSLQWTMERTIGNLSQEICQPSDPFSNLAQQGICCCQINALQALFPHSFDSFQNPTPHGSEDIGNGYVLLCRHDRCPIQGSNDEQRATTTHLERPVPRFYQWAHLQLPNGQIARSLWCKGQKSSDKVCISQNVKVGLIYSDIFIVTLI